MGLELDIIYYAVNSSIIMYSTLSKVSSRVLIPTSPSPALRHW